MSSAVFSFTGSVLFKCVLDPIFLVFFFLRQNNWRLHVTKSDACFIKCHLYKTGFAPKNVHFKIKFHYPCWCQSRFGSLEFCCHVFSWSCLSFPQILVLQRLQDPVTQPSLTLGKWSLNDPERECGGVLRGIWITLVMLFPSPVYFI